MKHRAMGTGTLVCYACLLPVVAAAGQDQPPAQSRATWYAGAAAVWWHTARGKDDPMGAGYLYTVFHGAPGARSRPAPVPWWCTSAPDCSGPGAHARSVRQPAARGHDANHENVIDWDYGSVIVEGCFADPRRVAGVFSR